MTKFTVEASEVVFYTFHIEADTMEEAQAMIARGDFETGAPIDGDDFEVTGIYESKESVAS